MTGTQSMRRVDVAVLRQVEPRASGDRHVAVSTTWFGYPSWRCLVCDCRWYKASAPPWRCRDPLIEAS